MMPDPNDGVNQTKIGAGASLLIIIAMFLIWALDEAVGPQSQDPAGDEPFVGLCNEPSTHGGC